MVAATAFTRWKLLTLRALSCESWFLTPAWSASTAWARCPVAKRTGASGCWFLKMMIDRLVALAARRSISAWGRTDGWPRCTRVGVLTANAGLLEAAGNNVAMAIHAR